MSQRRHVDDMSFREYLADSGFDDECASARAHVMAFARTGLAGVGLGWLVVNIVYQAGRLALYVLGM